MGSVAIPVWAEAVTIIDELCPLDNTSEMETVGFTEVYNGYDLDISSAVVSSSDAFSTVSLDLNLSLCLVFLIKLFISI